MHIPRASFTGGTGTWGDALHLGLRLIRKRYTPSQIAGDLERCHEQLKAFFGVRHVFTYGAARMGLYEALRALGVGPGDEVVVPGFTCAVVSNAVLFAGARPVYADIDPVHLGPNVDQIRGRLSKRTRAILTHHLFGIPSNIEEVLELGRSSGLPVIEDAAQAPGGRFKGHLLGTFGLVGVFSCEASKMISTGNGGILVTDETKLASKLGEQYKELPYQSLAYANLAMSNWLLTFLTQSPLAGFAIEKVLRQVRKIRTGLGKPWRFECESFFEATAMYENEYAGIRSPAYPWRMNSALSWLLLRQLDRLNAQVKQRAELASALAEILNKKGAGMPRIDHRTMQPAWLRFPFWVDDPRDWSERLRRAGIPSGPWPWFEGPIHPRSCCDNPWFAYERGSCPRGEWLGSHMLNIPITPRLGRWLLNRVARL